MDGSQPTSAPRHAALPSPLPQGRDSSNRRSFVNLTFNLNQLYHVKSASNSLRLVPASSQPSKITLPSLETTGAPSSSSVHDTIRHGLPTTSSDLNSNHPLENRLKNWGATQENLKMESLKRTFGLAEPVRRGMEKMIVGADFRPALLGGPSNLHMDILNGRECWIDWEDVFVGDNLDGEVPDFHTEFGEIMRGKQR
ncbi:hypothetical protein H072_382 [Dactylellina haptotyla CBS 200.50]|uniref:Proteasome maturation factor UMP1 n=1 Tax=Dactylellina haptotyla (strain CBS 200.50) TaxID=1284197 RepID=S8ARN1_DACHA|nr:hypothetical protein H072_382 [Dactylellina haptotyla CBS 200.50]